MASDFWARETAGFLRRRGAASRGTRRSERRRGRFTGLAKRDSVGGGHPAPAAPGRGAWLQMAWIAW